MNALNRFCKALSIKQIPTSIENTHKVASYCNSAAYNVLPVGIRFSRGEIFCALLLGLMLGFSACGKTENIAADPTRGGGNALNQGVSFTIDTTWLPDTIIDFTPQSMNGLLGHIRWMLRSRRTRQLDERAMAIADKYGMRKQYLEARKFGYTPLEALEDWDMVDFEDRIKMIQLDK